MSYIQALESKLIWLREKWVEARKLGDLEEMKSLQKRGEYLKRLISAAKTAGQRKADLAELTSRVDEAREIFKIQS